MFLKSLIIALKGKAVLEAIKDLKELNITFPSYITKKKLHLKHLEMEVFLKITLCLDELKLLSNISDMALAH